MDGNKTVNMKTVMTKSQLNQNITWGDSHVAIQHQELYRVTWADFCITRNWKRNCDDRCDNDFQKID